MGCTISLDGGKKSAEEEKTPSPSMASASDVQIHLGMPRMASKQDMFNLMKPDARRLEKVAKEQMLFDAHCHYLNFRQQSEGIDVLANAMDQNNVGFAVLTGTPFKKAWVSADQAAPEHPLFDDGDLYHYSMTDGYIFSDMRAAAQRLGTEFTARFAVTACGFNLGDFGVADEAKRLLGAYPCVGLGELTLQSDDINNMTIKGGNWTYAQPAVEQLLSVSAATPFPGRPIPLVFVSDARSISTKPYRHDFEYIEQVEAVVSKQAGVKCLWVSGGVFMRGQWKDYSEVLRAMLKKHPNLYISFTPEICSGKLKGITREDAMAIAAAYPTQCCVGTMIRGLFETPPPAAFGELSYSDEVQVLHGFVNEVQKKHGVYVAAHLRYRTAATLYNLPLPKDDAANPQGSHFKREASRGGDDLEALREKADKRLSNIRVSRASRGPSEGASESAINFMVNLTYGGATDDQDEAQVKNIVRRRSIGGGLLNVGAACPPSRATTWKSIDCHLHLLDFLQKSSGTKAALKAMDGCEVEKAVVFGMPCCKKWCFYRPEQPLYYQDDNGPCYVYAYADQMVADAWLALEDKERCRLAPCFASFDPTDLAAISHVRRMYSKYPKMWRGVGEVMCRHDDLTNMLLSREIPRINHSALNAIYEFCIEVGLPILMHHNADRVGDNDGGWSYKHEVEDVLRRYPKLKMVWVHAGVSRRCSEPNHYELIDQMCSDFPNLHIDISWVVWEDVICDGNGAVKPAWVECIQKHHDKFYIGSDNVAQFFPVNDGSTNLLAMNITKYWQLYDKLSPEAAENVSRKNAMKMYFDGWDVPSGSGQDTRYAKIDAVYDTECLDPDQGKTAAGRIEEVAWPRMPAIE